MAKNKNDLIWGIIGIIIVILGLMYFNIIPNLFTVGAGTFTFTGSCSSAAIDATFTAAQNECYNNNGVIIKVLSLQTLGVEPSKTCSLQTEVASSKSACLNGKVYVAPGVKVPYCDADSECGALSCVGHICINQTVVPTCPYSAGHSTSCENFLQVFNAWKTGTCSMSLLMSEIALIKTNASEFARYNNNTNLCSDPIVYCAQDALQCSDGSYVYRNSSKNCAFNTCPIVVANNSCITVADCGLGAARCVNGQCTAYDEHGCVPDAGYSWCESKQKCLRTWEETCGCTADVYSTCPNNITYKFQSCINGTLSNVNYLADPCNSAVNNTVNCTYSSWSTCSNTTLTQTRTITSTGACLRTQELSQSCTPNEVLSFIDKYLWWIVGAIVLLILVLLLNK